MVITLKLFVPLKTRDPSTLAKLPSCLSHIKSWSKNVTFTNDKSDVFLSGPLNTITYVGANLGSLSNNAKQATRNLAVILDFNLWIDYQFKECSCWWLRHVLSLNDVQKFGNACVYSWLDYCNGFGGTHWKDCPVLVSLLVSDWLKMQSLTFKALNGHAPNILFQVLYIF